MKKAKNKNLRRAVGFLALAALTAGLAAMPLLRAVLELLMELMG